MPWMLLGPPFQSDDSRGAAGDGPHESPVHADEVWILVGGLDRALLQAGIVSRLLATGPPPVAVIASGFALANALLISAGRGAEFDRRWEQLRASRFLASAAVGSVRVLGTLNGIFDDLSGLLAEIPQSRTRAPTEPIILAATEDGFSVLPRNGTTSSWRAAVKRSLRYSGESAPLLAGAIREAATRATRVLVLGPERTMQSHPDIDAAVEAATAEGARVTFVTATAPRKAGLLDYLLPGSGTPERLMQEGSAAADRWLGAADRNGPPGPNQVPSAGLGTDGVTFFSGPEDDELWTSDANDSSSWPK